MAFFLVMWLVGQSPNVKAAVAAYFRDPGVFETTRGGGVLPGGAEGLKDSGVTLPKAIPNDVRPRRHCSRRRLLICVRRSPGPVAQGARGSHRNHRHG
jgi:hypothetical protein